MLRSHAAGAVLALALAGIVVRAAPAVEPGLSHAQTPESLGLQAEEVTITSADSTAVSGWWFQGAKGAPVVVVAARGSGTMADMLPSVQQWLARGFAVLTFDYLGFGPGSSSEAVDSLRYIVFNSQWVDEMLGALRYARVRGGRHVFAWGQDLGGAVALAAAAREPGACDGVAVEGLFRTSQEALLANGTSVLNDIAIRHRRLVRGGDEPLSAAPRLRTPLFVVLAGKDEVTPVAATKTVAARARLRVDSWNLPEAKHDGTERSPGYFDRLGQWFKQWTTLPPGGKP
jgi:alpha-beta hydrolase superfamily lysophospholipase